MAADKIKTVGTIANSATTMMFDAVNYKAVSSNGATVFDTSFTNTPTRARTTLRIGKDELGRQVSQERIHIRSWDNSWFR